MAVYETLDIQIEDRIATVRFGREAQRNSLSRQMMEELTAFARAHKLDTEIRAIILRGADTYFCAGADMSLFAEGKDKSLMERRRDVLVGPEMCKAWEELQPITIAAIEGACIGGGAALALSCDFRICGEAAFMRLPEVPLGINMSWHSIPRLVTVMGPSRAKEFTMFGRPTSAATLSQWGAANAVTADGEAHSVALDWARELNGLPPLPVRMTKEAVNAAANALNHTATFMDCDQFLLTANTEDFAEGVDAFLEKRTPNYKGN